MLRYRPFRNTDPTALADVWRSRGNQPGLLQPVSADVFEQLVLGRRYFDCEGLILAWDGDRPVGFAHAGFGPSQHEYEISTELGVTCVVIVRPDCAEQEVAAGLLEQCEAYLRRRGAKVLYGGGIRPLNPFYVGLYGGSELPGVLDSDTVARELFRAHDYKEIDRTLIFRGDLGEFRATMNRRQLQIRRRMRMQVVIDPPIRGWWEASTMGDFDLTRFELVPRAGGQPVAYATLRSMDPTGMSSLGRAVGLIELHTEEPYRRQGMTTFLLTETFNHLSRQNIASVEVQTMQYNTAGVGLYRNLGFKQIDQGIVFRKEAGK